MLTPKQIFSVLIIVVIAGGGMFFAGKYAGENRIINALKTGPSNSLGAATTTPHSASPAVSLVFGTVKSVSAAQMTINVYKDNELPSSAYRINPIGTKTVSMTAATSFVKIDISASARPAEKKISITDIKAGDSVSITAANPTADSIVAEKITLLPPPPKQ
ncbi:hypothetical protein KW797_01635 [Candidatus Parcubacteria bacterium]|nr:hypothetical protein [Candidatus Parcubacteria bacterium]